MGCKPGRARVCLKRREPEAVGYQGEHDEPAVGVEADQTPGSLLFRRLGDRHLEFRIRDCCRHRSVSYQQLFSILSAIVQYLISNCGAGFSLRRASARPRIPTLTETFQPSTHYNPDASFTAPSAATLCHWTNAVCHISAPP